MHRWSCRQKVSREHEILHKGLGFKNEGFERYDIVKPTWQGLESTGNGTGRAKSQDKKAKLYFLRSSMV
jgi:hypothetical protein